VAVVLFLFVLVLLLLVLVLLMLLLLLLLMMLLFVCLVVCVCLFVCVCVFVVVAAGVVVVAVGVVGVVLCLYTELHGFAHTRLPSNTVRNVWCANALGSVERLVHHVCNLGNQCSPRTLDRLLLMDVSAAEVALRCLQVVTSADLRSGIFRGRERHAHEVA